MRALLTLLLIATAACAVATETPKVAVLRLVDAIHGFALYAEGKARLQVDHDRLAAQVASLGERLKELEGKLQVLQPDSEAFVKFSEEFEIARVRQKLCAE